VDKDSQARHREGGLLYRLEIEGTLPEARSTWLGADTVAPRGSNTVIHVQVADQSDLYGRLRIIHDLNLQLISVQRLGGDRSSNAGPDAGASGPDDTSGSPG
jgi:hypothetical protein